MQAIMHTAVRREIIVSVLLLSALGTCASEEQQKSNPNICSNSALVQEDALWMEYVRDSANHKGTSNTQEEGRFTPNNCTADRREAEGVEAAEGGRVEERKREINVGEYCWHYCLCRLTHRHY
jgi:hypothetical protein